MAKRKMLPRAKPRDQSREGDDMLLRSAESLGRVIAELQRELAEARLPMNAKATRKRKKS